MSANTTQIIETIKSALNRSETISTVQKTVLLDNLNKSNEDTLAPTIRNIISTPSVAKTLSNNGINTDFIMKETYKPRFSFKASEQTTANTSSQQFQPPPVNKLNKQNIKDAVIITKQQEVGTDAKGKREIIQSSIQVVKPDKVYVKKNEKGIPVNQNQSFKYSDNLPLLKQKLVNKNIPFSKKLLQQ